MTDFLWAVLPYLVPLSLLSIYSVGLILQKSLALRPVRVLGAAEFSRVLEGASAGVRTFPELGSDHPLSYLLTHAGDGPHLLQARAQALLAQLEDRISYFPALANISTLTGLFGTVMGMIEAFLALKSGGGADPSSLAGGLGTALSATALGLVTAIPSLAAHAIFQKKVQAAAAQMEALLSALLSQPGETGA